MKISLPLLLAIATLIEFSARADQLDGKKTPAKTKPEAAKSARPAREKGERVLWTGSLIPQRLHKSGLITDGTSPLIVIDQTAIERSGAATVAGVIRHYR